MSCAKFRKKIERLEEKLSGIIKQYSVLDPKTKKYQNLFKQGENVSLLIQAEEKKLRACELTESQGIPEKGQSCQAMQTRLNYLYKEVSKLQKQVRESKGTPSAITALENQITNYGAEIRDLKNKINRQCSEQTSQNSGPVPATDKMEGDYDVLVEIDVYERMKNIWKDITSELPDNTKKARPDTSDLVLFHGEGGGLNVLVARPGPSLVISYGNRQKDGAGTYTHTTHILYDIHIRSQQVLVTTDGQPIAVKYSFVARSLDKDPFTYEGDMNDITITDRWEELKNLL